MTTAIWKMAQKPDGTWEKVDQDESWRWVGHDTGNVYADKDVCTAMIHAHRRSHFPPRDDPHNQ